MTPGLDSDDDFMLRLSKHRSMLSQSSPSQDYTHLDEQISPTYEN